MLASLCDAAYGADGPRSADTRPDREQLVDAERALVVAQSRVTALRQREDAKARAAKEHNVRQLWFLPAELLLQVARIVVADSPRAVTRLAAICTSWRDVVHASPDLWQRIRITQRDKAPADIARAYVARSAHRPLDIELRLFAADDPATRGPDDSERELAAVLERLAEARDVLGRARSHPAPTEWPPVLEATLQELCAFKTRATAASEWDASLASAMQILCDQLPRCVSFRFQSTRRRPTELVAEHIQAASAPLLRDLVLHLDPTCRLGPISCRHAPALATADLQGVLADPVPRFTLVVSFVPQSRLTLCSGLRKLRIVNGTFNAPPTALAPLLALLRANPNLEELCLQPLIPHTFIPLPNARVPSPNALVSLPRLTRLHLIHNSRLDRFLLQLNLPALTHLTLVVQTGAPGPLFNPIFQGAPYPNLHTLRLANIYIRAPLHERDLLSTLRQLSTLRTLSISESTLCDSMLRALSDPECCPLLEELVFERCEGIAHDTVLEIWRARASGVQGLDVGREIRRTRSTDIRVTNNGTLRSLVVRSSSTPLADMQLGESARS